MIRTRLVSLMLAAGLAGVTACATGGEPSRQLVDARRAYAEAAASTAPTHARKPLLSAHRALKQAEIAHREAPGSASEQHLAYLALRHAQIAESRAAAAVARQEYEQARTAYTSAVEQRGANVRVEVTRRDTDAAKRARELAERNRQLEQRTETLEERTQTLQEREAELARQAEALRAEREAREKLERERDEAMAKLEEFATIVEDERGTVITLGGALLFRTNETTLLPTARDKLDQVANALQQLETDQSLVIEGHADARGTKSFNRRLSAGRAEAVRAYLVARGVEPDKLITLGKGEEEPIASNQNPEGRANNRRVEIVISRSKAALAPEAPVEEPD